MSASDLTMTEAEFKSAVAEAIRAGNAQLIEQLKSSYRAPSKMEFSTESAIEVPVGHRKGNLPLYQKQLLNVMKKGGDFINDGISDSQLADAVRRGEARERKLMSDLQTKAITTTGAGSGLEWMDVEISSVLMQRMYMASLLAQEFAANEVQMPTNPFQVPLSTTRPTFKIVAEGNAATESAPGSDRITLTAVKLMGQVNYSYEADEDSILAVLPLVTSQLGDAAAEALEYALINGDTAATHQDSDTHAVAGHVGKAWDGIRKLALAQTALKVSLATGGISAANILKLKKALGRWGLDPSKLILVCGARGYNDVVGLEETLTAEKAGSQSTARILTGRAPNIYGIDIVPSAAVREDLNASGVFDNTTTTKGSVLMVYKPAWVPGVRRGFTIEQGKSITTQQKMVVASFRRDWKPMESLNAANAAFAAIGINFDS
jgi:HK97 family phage major capsid protein